MDIENELHLISCHRCNTVSRSKNQITQGTKYIQSVREGSQPCQKAYKISQWITMKALKNEEEKEHHSEVLSSIPSNHTVVRNHL